MQLDKSNHPQSHIMSEKVKSFYRKSKNSPAIKYLVYKIDSKENKLSEKKID